MPVPFSRCIFARGTRSLRLFTTIATLGTPQDITLQELRIEFFLPMDEETAKLLRSWAKPARRKLEIVIARSEATKQSRRRCRRVWIASLRCASTARLDRSLPKAEIPLNRLSRKSFLERPSPLPRTRPRRASSAPPAPPSASGPSASSSILQPGAAASVIRPMMEVPPTVWPSLLTRTSASKPSAHFTKRAEARACRPRRLTIVR